MSTVPKYYSTSYVYPSVFEKAVSKVEKDLLPDIGSNGRLNVQFGAAAVDSNPVSFAVQSFRDQCFVIDFGILGRDFYANEMARTLLYNVVKLEVFLEREDYDDTVPDFLNCSMSYELTFGLQNTESAFGTEDIIEDLSDLPLSFVPSLRNVIDTGYMKFKSEYRQEVLVHHLEVLVPRLNYTNPKERFRLKMIPLGYNVIREGTFVLSVFGLASLYTSYLVR